MDDQPALFRSMPPAQAQWNRITASSSSSSPICDKYDEYRAWTVAQLLAFKKAFGSYILEALASGGVLEAQV